MSDQKTAALVRLVSLLHVLAALLTFSQDAFTARSLVGPLVCLAALGLSVSQQRERMVPNDNQDL